MDGPTACETAGGSEVRTVVHLHGAHVREEFDGHPEAWFTNNAVPGAPFEHGEKFTTNRYQYTNDQAPCTLFYHDHTLGITRLNVYAGLAGLYILEDRPNVNPHGLPSGEFDIPLVFSERTFDIRNGKAEMVYPYALKSTNDLDFPSYSMLAENFGDVMIVNGMAYPNLDVKRRQYRFRLANTCDSRFVRVELLVPSTGNLVKFRVVAGDQGYIPVVGPVTDTDSLLVGPFERFDIIVDFSVFAANTKIIFTNTETSLLGPVTPLIDDTFMRFTVVSSTKVNPTAYAWSTVDPDKELVELVKEDNAKYYASRTHSVMRRQAIVTEMEDVTPGLGIRPFPHLGAKKPVFAPLGQEYMEEPDMVKCGVPEIWEIINLTPDWHPIHIHQVHFRILGRETITPTLDFYRHGNGVYRYNGVLGGKNTEPPYPWELAPKDIVVIPSRGLVRLVMKFDLTGEYMWHCHILSHEDHLMMRKFDVTPSEFC
eukprot:TRINITY_DN3285_c0_g1_i1.p1 TRINITY_DN3285_c0_g1~~TRINITY_DN3285_c0_g1_i1.p1  ORF type:complete len:513 (-),score=-5.81 TRINITY_DN3285_c0_g1_i1:34-1479(-)